MKDLMKIALIVAVILGTGIGASTLETYLQSERDKSVACSGYRLWHYLDNLEAYIGDRPDRTDTERQRVKGGCS